MPRPSLDLPTAEEALRRGTEFLRSLKIPSPRLEMEIILAEVMELDRIGLYTQLERRLTPEERDASREMLTRRRNREPLAYILGRREFYGLTFGVGPSVLVPRPETELIVDLALAFLRQWAESRPPVLADIGTGSGAIAIACARMQSDRDLPGDWIATDIQPEALDLARENAAALGVAGRIEFRQGSIYEPLEGAADLIASNPPYIGEGERESLMAEVAQFEPPVALFSGKNGLEHLETLIGGAADHLNPGGLLLLELGVGQEAPVRDYVARAQGLSEPEFHADLAGISRVLSVRRL